jgi:hypothetical protein
VLNRRHSDAALLVLAVAALALILTVTLTLHHLVIGDEDQPRTAVLVSDDSAGVPLTSSR